MKRLIADEQIKLIKDNITCYADMEELFDAEILKNTICEVMERIFMEYDNKEFVDKYLDEDGSAKQNNDRLNYMDYSDVSECIYGAIGEGLVGAYVIEALNADINEDETDVYEIGEEVYRVWDGYSYADIIHLMDEVLPQKWEQIREEYPEYFVEAVTVRNIYELLDVEDEVGDIVELDGCIDYNCRNSAFLYLDGDIVWGEHGKTHTQTLQSYNEEQENDVELSSDFDRVDADEIQEKNDVEAVGFGHYGNDVAVIDYDYVNCDEYDISNALLGQTDKTVEKVYFNDYSGSLSRVAKYNRLLKN